MRRIAAHPRRGVVVVAENRPRFHFDFLGHRKLMYTISAVLLVISIAALLVRGLTWGIEFEGGTIVDISRAPGITEQQVSQAFSDSGVQNAIVQTAEGPGEDGFIVRTPVTDPVQGNEDALKVALALDLPADVFHTTVIGPDWGSDISRSSFLAFFVSIGAIIVYMSLRFEWKMSLTAVIALIHDLIIIVGVFALTGREVTPNTIAALLTILGYSLYDAVVVFHRIKDNEDLLGRMSFERMANLSINEVFMRTINTSLSSLIPVLALLLFGGDTLVDFAFALSVGLIVGSYSSIAIATPLYVAWKEREPRYAALKKRHDATSR